MNQFNIVDVIKEYYSPKKNGKNFLMNCPFHDDKSPSFYIYTDSNQYHCFGCKRHGGPIDFVMEEENIDSREALSKLNNRFNQTVSLVETEIQRFNRIFIDYISFIIS